MHRKESSGNLQIHFENSMSLWLLIFFLIFFEVKQRNESVDMMILKQSASAKLQRADGGYAASEQSKKCFKANPEKLFHSD